MKGMRSAGLVLPGLLLFAATAVAQGNPTGKLTGHVTSEGKPLPGVSISVSSPSLQGARTTVTSSNGDYLFAALPPGEYAVTFTMQSMRAVSQSVTVSAAQSSQFDTEMSMAAVTEEIMVTGTLETISQGPLAATTYSKTLVDELPIGRTVNDVVTLAPGVHATGPGKDATSRLGSITISGSASFENLFLVNGVVINENIRGQALDLFIEDSIQETTTATAGVSAEYGRFAGGIVNVITKSGGNNFSGSLRVGLTNQKWEKETALTTERTDKTIPTYEATFGGPAVRDRLWFFLAGRTFDRTSTQQTSITNVPFAVERDQQRYEGKATFSLNPSHNFIASYLDIKDAENGNFFGAILDTKSLVNRTTPQRLYAGNYTGLFTENFLLTAQYSQRKFTFENSGATSTDLITGTLLLDRTRGNARYHSPTFCGVCGPERRDNKNALVKGSYFLSTAGLGSHELVAGFDQFKDIREANNHQSGSDFRVFGSSAILRGDDIFPVFLPDSTIIQYNPISRASQGTDFVTNSLFFNDVWRYNNRLSFNLGLRYDQNDGKDAEGKKVASDSNLSPRVAATFDPRANGDWLFHASYGQYVAALANSVADSTSSAGQPATFQYTYKGPAVNPSPNGALLDQDAALRILFNWFNGAGGVNGVPPIFVDIPGGSTLIRGSLDSPNVREVALGVSKRLGSRGVARLDLIHRDFADFYAARTDLSTGQITTSNGRADLNLIENSNRHLERTYDAVETQFRLRFRERFDLGGNWTLSHLRGNFDGENRNSGPLTGDVDQYPEYKERRWNSPSGDLTADQRHKLSLYGIWNALSNDHSRLSVSVLESFFSGRPYEAIGTVRSINYVTNPGYRTPPARVNYFFTGRGALTTDNVLRTDLAVNYSFNLKGVELFVQPEIINLLNADSIDTTDSRFFDTTVITADNTSATRLCSQAGPGGTAGPCQPFNPFTTTPVEHVNWEKGPNFGKAIQPLGFQQPRTFRISLGIRF